MTHTEELGPYEAWQAFEYAVAHIDETQAAREAQRRRDNEAMLYLLRAQQNHMPDYRHEDFRPMNDEETKRYYEARAENASFLAAFASIFGSVSR